MKSVILIVASMFLFCMIGHAQPPPSTTILGPAVVAPVVAPAAIIKAVEAPVVAVEKKAEQSIVSGFFSSLVQSQGGFMAAIIMILGIANLILSFLAQLFAKLSLSEPGWLQTIGSILLTVTQWLSANTPTPAIQKKS